MLYKVTYLYCDDVICSVIDADQMIYPTQMQVYLRRWRPSSFIVDPIQEIIMDDSGLDHLRKKVGRGGRDFE